MADVIISEFMDEPAVEELRRSFSVVYDPGLVDRPAELERRRGEARALIVRNRTQVRGAVLDAARNLSCVGRLGVGLDNIDVEACERARHRGATPRPGRTTLSVAEYVITAALLLLRGAYGASGAVTARRRGRASADRSRDRRQAAGRWSASARSPARLRCGRSALGMTVGAYDPYLPADHEVWQRRRGKASTRSSPNQRRGQSAGAALTKETRSLIDAGAIARMKPDAILINAARGGIVDEAAVAAALREGASAGRRSTSSRRSRSKGAAAEVFRGVPNLILTPHIAGVTVESNGRVSLLTAENVRRHLDGPA